MYNQPFQWSMQMITIELTECIAYLVCMTNHIRHKVNAEQDSCDAEKFTTECIDTHGGSDEAVKMWQDVKGSHEFD